MAIPHGGYNLCPNGHQVNAMGNALTTWHGEGPPPKPHKPGDNRRNAEIHAKRGDFVGAAWFRQRQYEENERAKTEEPRRWVQPADATTYPSRQWEAPAHGTETPHLCPQCGDTQLMLHHDRPELCPTCDHVLLLLGATLRIWPRESPTRTEFLSKTAQALTRRRRGRKEAKR